MNPLVEIKNLSIIFPGNVKAVDRLSFSLFPGETVALLGESGSGKSATALAILRLLSQGAVQEGEIFFEGENLAHFSEKKMQQVRGQKIGMIFQDPMTALNPTLNIGTQISEALRLPKHQAREEALKMLHSVGISDTEKRMAQYPHELSGGMRQRVMIAIAMISSPKLLIADEPTTALDVTIQAQILELMKTLQKQRQMTTLLITHDLRVVASMADRVLVMYAGKIVEMGSVDELFFSPSHPYTEALLRSIPRLDLKKGQELLTIPGAPPKPTEKHSGCPFFPRCQKKIPCCDQKAPPLIHLNSTHHTSCWLYEQAD